MFSNRLLQVEIYPKEARELSEVTSMLLAMPLDPPEQRLAFWRLWKGTHSASFWCLPFRQHFIICLSVTNFKMSPVIPLKALKFKFPSGLIVWKRLHSLADQRIFGFDKAVIAMTLTITVREKINVTYYLPCACPNVRTFWTLTKWCIAKKAEV